MNPVLRFVRRTALCLLFVTLAAGCGRQEMETTAAQSVSEASSTRAQPAAIPGPGEKNCFQCDSAGTEACKAKDCRGGEADCPGPCLKLTKGNWRRMNVAGHDPNELWISFKTRTGTKSWSQGHVGEVVVYQNGDAVNIGPCKVCTGTTQVTCASCKGQGTQTCDLCSGKKFIPVAWTPTDNPLFNSQPDLIRLTDGRAILGRIAASSGDERTIVTRDKQIIRVNASEIVPVSPTNFAAPRADL